MRRWHVYSELKRTNGKADINALADLANGDEYELEEGIIEYNEMAKESYGYFRPYKHSGGIYND